MIVTNRKKIQHLFLRAGFGLRPEQIDMIESRSIYELAVSLIPDSDYYNPLEVLEVPDTNNNGEVTNFNILVMVLKSQDELQQLNHTWMVRMKNTGHPLIEKMTLFWHNHFACTSNFAYLMQVQNNFLRKNCLGSFRTMLHGLSKDPAMIFYLNNQQNHKDHPNENFAREVMELFSLGIGNYTENDIKEAARAFTGWTVNKKGKFEFVLNDHDDGEKTIFGKTGTWNGEDVINMLLEKPECARYITRKIYREFVNENVNETRIISLTDDFLKSDYDIGLLMKNILTSEWFYDEENIGTKICSPVEFIVRMKRIIDLQFDDYKQQVAYQKVLGQVLFMPPNVAGWKGGRNWIDSSSLLYRLNLAKVVAQQSAFEIQAKPEYEENTVVTQKIKVTAKWKPVIKYFMNSNTEDQLLQMKECYLQCNNTKSDFESASKTLFAPTEKQAVLNNLLSIFSSPEFQLI